MEVGFCDAAGRGFYLTQPTSHLERWALPVDNGTHLVIAWSPDRSACGRNVSSYFVDVQTSTPVLNLFIGLFGSFPQDLCDPRGSKAKKAVACVDEGGTCALTLTPAPSRPRALALTRAGPAHRVARVRSFGKASKPHGPTMRSCHAAYAAPPGGVCAGARRTLGTAPLAARPRSKCQPRCAR